jgi:hypothetical protein
MSVWRQGTNSTRNGGSVYRRYAIVSEADLLEGVEKLAALHTSESTSARTVVPFPGRTSTILAQSGEATG